MQKFQNMKHSNSTTFQRHWRTYFVFKDFQKPEIFFSKFKDFQRLLKNHEPWSMDFGAIRSWNVSHSPKSPKNL